MMYGVAGADSSARRVDGERSSGQARLWTLLDLILRAPDRTQSDSLLGTV